MPIWSFDLETTGLDTATALPVQIAVEIIGEHCGIENDGFRCIVDPGIEIPEEAAAIHGITTERSRDEGVPLDEAVSALHATLHTCAMSSRPLVVFNARYDIPIAARLFEQHGGTLPELCILDPFVIDRHFDKYRKGRRTLGAMCEHYGVELTGAHDASADAVAAARLMRTLAEVYPTLAKKTPAALQVLQAGWFEDWKKGFNDYLARKSDNPDFVTGSDNPDFVTGTWPL